MFKFTHYYIFRSYFCPLLIFLYLGLIIVGEFGAWYYFNAVDLKLHFPRITKVPFYSVTVQSFITVYLCQGKLINGSSDVGQIT